ncbi:hypothetical protein P167DRAFT_579650 [Morchella conica CCBAS932]|uniref:Uncharacterized protein n=1 Tax=Morchella conica CCBAS932 TaxID=1392247 RepID=A0A3N4KFI4_9PEZI|nr:hypothetical protein P167DRAFT_579650 [Morchella conica CCBAS932]
MTPFPSPLKAYHTDLAAHITLINNLLKAHSFVHDKAADVFTTMCREHPRGNYTPPSVAGGMEIRLDQTEEESLRGVHVAFLKGCMDWHVESCRALERRMADVGEAGEAEEAEEKGEEEVEGEEGQEEGEGWIEVGSGEDQAAKEKGKGKRHPEEKEKGRRGLWRGMSRYSLVW